MLQGVFHHMAAGAVALVTDPPMQANGFLFATVLVPLVGAFLLPLVGTASPRLRNWLAVALGVATTLSALALLSAGPSGPQGAAPAAWMGWLPTPLFVVDHLAILMAVCSSFISTLIIIYSVGYIKDYPHQQEYYLMVLLFLGAMMGLVFSANLLLLYVFWEITGICSWRLIGFFRQKDYVVKADKAFLVTFGGAVLMLLGIALVYADYGTFDLGVLAGCPISGLAAGLILAGIFTKSATLPFHTWLPDAGVAPTTVTALLHAAVLVKIGVYAFARIFNSALVLPDGWGTGLMLLGLASTVVSACAALGENNLKRLLAYSTVSQIGYIFIGLATFQTIGVAGALLFIMMHGLAKAGLFLSAGVIEHGTGTRDIARLGGLRKSMPGTAVAFLLCALSVIGIVPFGGFYAKGLVIKGVLLGGHGIIAALAILAAVLTAAYLLRAFVLIFLGDPRDPSIHAHHEGTPGMVRVVMALAVLALLGGLFVSYPESLADRAAAAMVNNPALLDAAGAEAHR